MNDADVEVPPISRCALEISDCIKLLHQKSYKHDCFTTFILCGLPQLVLSVGLLIVESLVRRPEQIVNNVSPQEHQGENAEEIVHRMGRDFGEKVSISQKPRRNVPFLPEIKLRFYRLYVDPEKREMFEVLHVD
ncbi:hypothetical protein KIN20_028751 [Parelaphostrongylus tenuis]|uniref:Uncharacterized protein n=1 Tax=Parelaphostrongylus tenuis TaxID=148309 RepID=A0AAD5R1L6_PARTN|nr:hypothetical protein KIN20_028751 [Parelaphostrongylus tenuis]